MTLIGFTEKRGNAWHYKREEQGDESNHYVGAIPIEDVRRRLFSWDAYEGTVETAAITPDGVLTYVDPDKKHIVRPPGALSPDDLGGIVGHVGGQAGMPQGWKLHQYREWLLDTVGHILDDDLSIGSAGLLKQGKLAWVSVEVPDNITTPSGVVFRPLLLAATALDGSLSTTYKRVVTNVVCDNTMAAGLGEKGQQIKIRHTRNSSARLMQVRDALELVHTIGDDFTAKVEKLTNTAVSAGDWAKFLDELVPLTDKQGQQVEGRSLALRQGKRDKITGLYDDDPRVAPWKGTAWGVVQAVNTFTHHIQGVSNKSGPEIAQRNMLKTVEGGTDKLDRDTLSTLTKVLEPAA